MLISFSNVTKHEKTNNFCPLLLKKYVHDESITKKYSFLNYLSKKIKKKIISSTNYLTLLFLFYIKQ